MIISNQQKIISTIVVSLFLIFAGCSDSSTDSENGNSNGNNQSASFQSETIAPGETYSYTFEEEETVDYYCSIHTPDMTGKITVTSSAAAVDRDTVSMEGNQFVPENLDVAPNTEVVWINNQNHDHNIRTGTPSSGGNGDTDY